jgi:lysyl oxidase
MASEIGARLTASVALLLIASACHGSSNDPSDPPAPPEADASAPREPRDAAADPTVPGTIQNASRRLCTRDADCTVEQICCLTGRLGSCAEVDSAERCPRPDLVVFADANLAPTFSERVFLNNRLDSSCAVDKGCVGGAGARRLLRFTLHTANLGDADFVLGVPGMNGITQSSCDDALYSESFLRYELLADGGALVAEGSGIANQCAFYPWDQFSTYNCSVVGLQRHSVNTYDADMECQWLDITNVRAGEYVLRVSINLEGRDLESNPDNNTLELPVHVPERDPLLPCDSTIQRSFTAELECGWSLLADATDVPCAPGENVQIACTACSLFGVADVRICSGASACSAVAQIPVDTRSSESLSEPTACTAESACGGSGLIGGCETLQFQCPVSGAYTLLENPFASQGITTSCVTSLPVP